MRKLLLKPINIKKPEEEKAIDLNDVKNLPEHLRNAIPPAWRTFMQNCLKELEESKALKPGEYKGPVHKGLYNGAAIFKSLEGEIFKGNFKDGKKHG